MIGAACAFSAKCGLAPDKRERRDIERNGAFRPPLPREFREPDAASGADSANGAEIENQVFARLSVSEASSRQGCRHRGSGVAGTPPDNLKLIIKSLLKKFLNIIFILANPREIFWLRPAETSNGSLVPGGGILRCLRGVKLQNL